MVVATNSSDQPPPPKPIAHGSLVVIVMIVIVAIIHTIRDRAFQEVWRGSLIWAVLILGIVVLVTVIGWIMLRPRAHRFWIMQVLFAPLIAALLSFFCYSIAVLLKDLFLWLRDPNTLSWRATAASLLVLLIGASLFYFRLRFRTIYGTSEVLIGVGIAMQRVVGTPKGAVALTTDVFLALLSASIYLVVRGCDNIHRGLTKEPLDPLATAIVKWLRARSVPSESLISTPPKNEPWPKPDNRG
jgi:hypothetical protein